MLLRGRIIASLPFHVCPASRFALKTCFQCCILFLTHSWLIERVSATCFWIFFSVTVSPQRKEVQHRIVAQLSFDRPSLSDVMRDRASFTIAWLISDCFCSSGDNIKPCNVRAWRVVGLSNTAESSAALFSGVTGKASLTLSVALFFSPRCLERSLVSWSSPLFFAWQRCTHSRIWAFFLFIRFLESICTTLFHVVRSP